LNIFYLDTLVITHPLHTPGRLLRVIFYGSLESQITVTIVSVRLDLVNTGSVPLEYSWQIVMDDFTTMRTAASTAAIQPLRSETPRPVTAGPLLVQSGTLRPSSSLSVNGTPGVDDVRPVSGNSTDPPLVPFVIEPANGVISPGKLAAISVKFSPLDVNDYEGRLICRLLPLLGFSTLNDGTL
jgi:hypothetical protein